MIMWELLLTLNPTNNNTLHQGRSITLGMVPLHMFVQLFRLPKNLESGTVTGPLVCSLLLPECLCLLDLCFFSFRT